MDSPRISQPILSLVVQARKTASDANLSPNLAKLSTSQSKLLINILNNKDNIWNSLDSNTKNEIPHIIGVLAGFETPKKSNSWSFPETNKVSNEEIIETIKATEKHLKDKHVFREKTTKELFFEMRGTTLKTDDQLTAQLYRDYSFIQGHVKINGRVLEMIKPKEKPKIWDDLIPKELKAYIGPDYPAYAPYIATLLTQGIAFDPEMKGFQILKDPIFPDATFGNKNKKGSLEFEFNKSDKFEIILTVKTKGSLRVISQDGKKYVSLRNYQMSQVINLTDVNDPVTMTISPI